MARSGNLPAELERRDSDVRIAALLLPKIPPFSELKSMTKLFNFPGSVVVRRLRKGEVVCRQGDAGWTAFYIPTTEELIEIREAPKRQLAIAEAELVKAEAQLAEKQKQLLEAAADPKKSEALRAKVAEAEEQVADVKSRIGVLTDSVPYLAREIVVAVPGDGTTAPESERGGGRQVLSVELAVSRGVPGPKRGIVGAIVNAVTGRNSREPARPASAGPRGLGAERMQGALNEGEIFGEMSCLYRSPRSATVIALRDCYIIEMLRNVLDAMLRDTGFRTGLDRSYRERVLALHLRNIPILAGLDATLLARACQEAELVDLPSGALLYDENDVSDGSMHLIRSGVIKVVQNVSFLLSADDIIAWDALGTELMEGRAPATSPKAAVWARLSEPARAVLQAGPADQAAGEQKTEVVSALNAIIKDPLLDESPEIREVARAQRAGRKVWQRLASARMAGERELNRCQRLLLELLYGSKLPEWKPAEDDDLATYRYRVDEFRDWKAAATVLVDGAARPGEPKRRVWDLLGAPIHAALEEAKAGKPVEPEVQARVVDALNAIVRGRPLILYPEFQDYLRTKKPARLVMEFLPDNQAWTEADYVRFCRAYNRFVLDGVFPNGLATSLRPEGPPRVLAYRSPGEAVGEMALVDNKPRNATLVAYSHPDDDPEREVGATQLVRVGKALFEALRAASPAFNRSVIELTERRRAELRVRSASREPSAAPVPVHTEQAESLGLFQGQKLMLIDLEKCTRCDECVQACVNTHEDGYSRLFLDGPRYSKFLVPSTCRSCLDPVCMIGCPVGSIHRGRNNEIVIEDWCIGCEQCANQCPYGSIQMHTVGVIPGGTFGWRYTSAANAAPGWQSARRTGHEWNVSSTPFLLDRELRAALLAPVRSRAAAIANPATAPICFRYEFDAPESVRKAGANLVLALTSMDEGASVWVNGSAVVARDAADPAVSSSARTAARRKSRDFGWWEIETVIPGTLLRASGNVVAVQVNPCQGNGDRLLDLRLDVEQGATVKLVEQKAVVCDLCSSSYGQVPACVTACPHDAAIRIDALSQLPLP